LSTGNNSREPKNYPRFKSIIFFRSLGDFSLAALYNFQAVFTEYTKFLNNQSFNKEGAWKFPQNYVSTLRMNENEES
jgi:hypothetical protein